MKAYAKNILPAASSYVTTNATVTADSILFSKNGGVARVIFTQAILKSTTEYMRLSLIAAPGSDAYTPDIHVSIFLQSKAGEYFSYVCNPVCKNGKSFVYEFELVAGEYDSFVLEFSADKLAEITHWELCPEAAGDTETIIDGIKQSLPRVLYDYNREEHLIKQDEEVVGIISCRLLQDTDLQAHLMINVEASEYCTCFTRIYDSDNEELFSPILNTLYQGLNVIEVPHSYLMRDRGAHSFYVSMQASNGTLTIPVRGLLYTIDGGYLAEQLLSPDMDVFDISIKQTEGTGQPTEIWAIGIKDEKILVKRTMYTTDKFDTSWETMYDFGEGKSAAIEFNGEWQRYSGSATSTLVTEETPAIAIIRKDDSLHVYLNCDTENDKQLTDKAETVKMLRGYSSSLFPDHDQGLVVAWLSAGTVNYQQYRFIHSEKAWDAPAVLSTPSAADLQLHRLNDYRLGFLVQTEAENIWYITDRTYVAQAVPTEVADLKSKVDYVAFPMTLDEFNNISYEAIACPLEKTDEAQTDFSVRFTYPAFISTLPADVNEWAKCAQLRANNQPVSFTATIADNVLTFKADEPLWGSIKLHWKEYGILLHLDDKRYICCRQQEYAFSWNISRKIETALNEAKVLTMQSALHIEQCPQLFPKHALSDAATLSIKETSISATFIKAQKQMQEVPECTKLIASNVSLILTLEQSGNTPI